MASTYFITAILAYLLGSIPFGYLLVRRFRGADIRQTGSGNIGATNVLRSGAAGLGIATLLLDAAKGYLAVQLAVFLYTKPFWVGLTVLPEPRLYTVAAWGALFAILGHVFPVWLGFRGGKGVATGVGAFVALLPKAVLLVLLLFLTVVAISRYVSLGSMIAAALLPVIAYLTDPKLSAAALALTAAAALLIIVKHRHNLQRLLAGTEHRLEWRKA